MKFKMIALTGPKGSGKDTVARMIVEQYDDVKTIAFADPIKKVIQHLFDLDPTNNDQYDLFKRTSVSYQLPGWHNHSVSGRDLVREIGMLMRGYDNFQFNQYVFDHVNKEPANLWVVTDVRFNNEFQLMRDLGAPIIQVTRPGCDYDGHVTERGFAPGTVDFTIANDGSLSDLNTKTGSIVENIMKEWA